MNETIIYDCEYSTEMDARYFVMSNNGIIIYRGTYTQCLVIIGGLSVGHTIEEIINKSNGFIIQSGN